MPDEADNPIKIREAGLSDLDGLVALENRCFETDRVSRRSFRRFLERSTARLLVADTGDRIAGYALILLRSGTALARLYSLAVDPDFRGSGLARRLLAASERAAFEEERIVLRLEVRQDNEAAIGLYRASGYRPCGQVPDYYEDGCTALRMEKLLHGPGDDPGLGRGRAPYYAQTTEFTCGPACLIMAAKQFDSTFPTDTLTELSLWREATTIYLASGHGGCGPFGLATAAARKGLTAEVRLSPDEPLFLSSVRDPEKREVMRLVQEGYRRDALALGVAASDQPLTARELAAEVAKGAVAMVLISGYRMFGQKVPHWILVHDQDERHLIIHDPWLEHERHESPADAANLPIPDAEFERMARWGRTAVRAQVILRKE